MTRALKLYIRRIRLFMFSRLETPCQKYSTIVGSAFINFSPQKQQKLFQLYRVVFRYKFSH